MLQISLQTHALICSLINQIKTGGVGLFPLHHSKALSPSGIIIVFFGGVSKEKSNKFRQDCSKYWTNCKSNLPSQTLLAGDWCTVPGVLNSCVCQMMLLAAPCVWIPWWAAFKLGAYNSFWLGNPVLCLSLAASSFFLYLLLCNL